MVSRFTCHLIWCASWDGPVVTRANRRAVERQAEDWREEAILRPPVARQARSPVNNGQCGQVKGWLDKPSPARFRNVASVRNQKC